MLTDVSYNDEPAHRHSDRSMRSASGACVVEESAIVITAVPYCHDRKSYGRCRFLHCTHSADAPCVSVEMTEWGIPSSFGFLSLKMMGTWNDNAKKQFRMNNAG